MAKQGLTKKNRTIVIIPSNMKPTPWDEVIKVNRDFTLTTLQTMAGLRSRLGIFRFVLDERR